MIAQPKLEPSTTEAWIEAVNQRAGSARKAGSAERPAHGRETVWVEVPADEVGEALMQAWAVNGIDHLFFSSGSDIGWFQECAVKLRTLGRPTPRIITMLHENTNLNAALGYAMVSHRPALTAAHIDLGVMNYGAAIHSATHGRYPVMMTSGKPPNSYGGTTHHGDRDQSALWRGDMSDYGQIVRPYVKWDHDLRTTDNPGLIVSRALQVCMSEPTGPVYLSIPRDVAMMPIKGARFPTVAQLGVPLAAAGDPDSIRQAAELLVNARNPLVISATSGRDPRAFQALVDLAELAGLPVSDASRERANFPTTHPLYEGGPAIDQADVIVVLEAFVPWIPGYQEPRPEAKIISIGIEPVQQRNVVYEFEADLRIAGSPAATLHALYEECDRLITAAKRQEIAGRKQRIGEASAARRAKIERDALAQANAKPISPAYAAYCLSKVMDEDSILLNDVVSNGADVNNHVMSTRPDSVYRSCSAAGGWGSGAALGAKLAAPDRFVALASGDGFFLYGVPYAALWAAAKYRAPYLAMVFQNRGYTTGTSHVARHYPEGYSAREGDYEGGMIDPPPDIAKLAESAGAAGENVHEPEQLLPALERAARTVREGTPAVVSVFTPPLGQR